MFDSPIPSQDELHDFISDPRFPCVGAKSAVAHGQLSAIAGASIASCERDEAIVRALQSFAAHATAEQMYLSCAVIFSDNDTLSEAWFEEKLWERLRAFHVLDITQHEWDSSVSADPEDPAFSFSLGGKAFYVVGLHPRASRLGRRFSRPVMVFNLHNQFENLRASGTYEKFRKTIMARDEKLNGEPNPMLKVHGEASEAIQYSGRQITGEWKCPFHALHAQKDDHGH